MQTTTTSDAPRPAMAYRILGTTDDVTTCDLCGRQDLKSTVALQPLDPDCGPVGEAVYFGCDCAARAMRWTQKDVRREANQADRAREQAEAKRRNAIENAIDFDPAVRAARAAYQARRDAEDRARKAWVPFNEARQWPEYAAQRAAEQSARAMAEASVPAVA